MSGADARETLHIYYGTFVRVLVVFFSVHFLYMFLHIAKHKTVTFHEPNIVILYFEIVLSAILFLLGILELGGWYAWLFKNKK